MLTCVCLPWLLLIVFRVQDMKFLRDVVYPKIKPYHLAHDSYFCRLFEGSIPFPVSRNGSEHVGSVDACVCVCC